MELRTRVYPTEARYYCDKCAVFLDVGQEKNPNLRYLPKEEFNKINDHQADDSVLNALTVDQVLSVLSAIQDFDKCLEYFMGQEDRTAATVKFYGEMIPSGPMNRYVNPQDRSTQVSESLHQCNNPSCKFEIMLPRDYPYVDQTVGRMIRSPEELQHPDEVIRNVMKKHVGSTVVQNVADASQGEKEQVKMPEPAQAEGKKGAGEKEK